jgi:hypothetical protein
MSITFPNKLTYDYKIHHSSLPNTMKISKLLTYLLVMSLPLLAGAQSVRWQRTYNEPSNMNSVVVPSRDKSGYVVAGGNLVWGRVDTSYSFMFKVDRFGNVVWNLRDTMFATEMIGTLDSGFFMSGFTKRGNSRSFIQKLDKNGVVQWRTIYPELGGYIYIAELIQTADSNYLLYGHKNDSLFLRKLDQTGTLIWQKQWFDRPLSVYQPSHLIELSTSGFVFTNNGSFQDTTACLLKADALGNLLWRRPLLDPNQGLTSLAETNGVITYLEQNTCIRQYDFSGNMIRRNCFNFPNGFLLRTDKRIRKPTF